MGERLGISHEYVRQIETGSAACREHHAIEYFALAAGWMERASGKAKVERTRPREERE